MKPLDRGQLQETIRARRIEWRKHVLQRMAERNISQAAVLGERVRDYPEDKPFASALFLGYDGPPSAACRGCAGRDDRAGFHRHGL